MPGRPGEEAALVKPTCLQRSRRIRLARGRVELCGQLGSAVTFPSIRSKLMIAPDPLPSGHRAAASAGSGACGAGEEHTAGSLWAWAGGRSAQQAGSGSWTNRASGGDCVWGSPLGQVPATCPGLKLSRHLCPPPARAALAMAPFGAPGVIPCACAEELQPHRVARRVGSVQRHSSGARAWWEVGCWYSKVEPLAPWQDREMVTKPSPGLA